MPDGLHVRCFSFFLRIFGIEPQLLLFHFYLNGNHHPTWQRLKLRGAVSQALPFRFVAILNLVPSAL